MSGWLFAMDREAEVTDSMLEVTDKTTNVMDSVPKVTVSTSKVADNLADDRLLFLLEMHCYDKVEGSRRQRRRIKS